MMNYLKRRFSSGDLQGEGLEDESTNQILNLTNAALNKIGAPSRPQAPPPTSHLVKPSTSSSSSTGATSAYPPTRPQNISNNNSNTTNIKKIVPSPSAPNSPTKSLSITSMMSAARDILSSNTFTPNTNASSTNQSTSKQMFLLKDKTKNLLIIDDSNIDWSRYFRGRKIGDFDLKTEQTEFRKISLGSYVDTGTVVDILVERNGSKVVKSFKPDFVLVRQHVKNADKDWRNIIIGLKYGSVPSINSMDSIYNFRDKPWVFAHLIQIQKTFGADKFPLINQTYHPNYREMIPSTFPCVVKIGHAHQGLGKIKVENVLDFQDITSIVSISNSYSTTEPFIDSKCDIHIQKIGESYKAFMRKSITGHWKANTGSAMLEQIPMTERYKFWIDEVSKIFGGLQICEIQAVVHAETQKEYIIDVVDSAITLLGEQQDGDRRLIAELCIDNMRKNLENSLNSSHVLNIPSAASSSSSISASVNLNSKTNVSIQSLQNVQQSVSNNSINREYNPQPTPSTSTIQKSNENIPNKNVQSTSSNSIKDVNSAIAPSRPSHPSRPKTPETKQQTLPNPQLASGSTIAVSTSLNPQGNTMERSKSTNNPNSNQKSTMLARSATLNENNTKNTHNNILKTVQSIGSSEDGDDTMNNLRKTFAGIFGNSNL